MTESTRTRIIPAPFYAAAGAGDLAYRRLRQLPEVAAAVLRAASTSGTDLRERALAGTIELREKTAATVKAANATATELRDRAGSQLGTARDPRNRDLDVDRLRETAKRNAAAFLAGAQAAQKRAVAVYGDLVAHGERVIGGGILEAADVVNTDIEATEATEPELPAKAATSNARAATPTKVATPAKAAATPTKTAKAVKATKRPRTTDAG